MIKRFLIIVLILLIPVSVFGNAFYPGAEGFGTQWSLLDWPDTTPDIYFINTLSPNTAASQLTCATDPRNINFNNCGTDWKAYTSGYSTAVNASGARIIIFEFSGTIDQTSSNVMGNNPYLWIAGQTAPEPGVLIKGWGGGMGGGGTNSWLLAIETHHVVVQHVRFRVGDTSDSRDGIALSAPVGDDNYNILIDHCSISWATDGGLDVFEADGAPDGIMRDFTFRQNIITETLDPHAYATVIGGQAGTDGAKDISLIGNLYAHNTTRQPAIGGGVEGVFVNNVSYNSQYYDTVITNAKNLGPHVLNIQANVGISGPSESNSNQNVRIISTTDTNSEIYVNDAPCDAPFYHGEGNWNGVRSDVNPYDTVKEASATITTSPLTIKPTAGNEVRDWVLVSAGAYPAWRDAVDTAVIASVTAGTGAIIADESDSICAAACTDGEFPSIAENTRRFDLDNNPHTNSGDGYTNLEAQIYVLQLVVEGFTAVTVTATDADAAEQGSDTGTWTIACSPNCDGVTVNLSYSGDAVLNTDYDLSNGEDVEDGDITITGANDTIDLTPVDDDVQDVAETATLTIDVGTGYIPGQPNSANIVIADNDGAQDAGTSGMGGLGSGSGLVTYGPSGSGSWAR